MCHGQSITWLVSSQQNQRISKKAWEIMANIEKYSYKQVCWASLQLDQNLQGLHVTRQQQLSINICCGPMPDLSSKPAHHHCCCRLMGWHADGCSTVL